MNDDLISRAAAIDAIVNTVSDVGLHDNSETARYGATYRQQEILTILESLPSADRPQGEWIRTGRTNIYGGIEVQCSNCNNKVMVQHLEDEWYCRHCGADMGMKGADDEND